MKKAGTLLFLALILAVPLSLARAEVSYTVDPGIIKIIAPPGGSRSGTIKVYARSPERIKVKVYAEDWTYANGAGIRAFFTAKNTAFSCADWITFSPAEFVIPPYEIGVVNYVINVPSGAEGGRYAVLFFETSVVTPTEIPFGQRGEGVQARSTMNIRLGAVFYVDVKGTVKRSIELGRLSISKEPRRKRYLLASNFKNNGNADVIVRGTFHIMDSGGKIVMRGKFIDAYAMPGDQAQVTARWQEALPKGRYNVVVTLGLAAGGEGEKISRGGAFTKEAEIEIGEDGELLSAGEFR